MNKKWFGKKRVDASDLADMLGDALDQAFERHLPSPEDIAGSIAKAIEDANFSSADQLGKVKAAFVENQTALTEKWGEVISQLQQTQTALSDLPSAMQSALSAETERWKEAASVVGSRLDAFPAAHAEALQAVQTQTGDVFTQFNAAFTDQVGELKQTCEKLGEQLSGIGELTKGMDKILHVQESVDGLMSQVAAADEMKKLFSELQENLKANSTFLQEAAKPRVVRLVESEEA